MSGLPAGAENIVFPSDAGVVDITKNPAAPGRYFRAGDGTGLIGIHTAYSSETGPFLIRDVTVRGFDIGIKTTGLNSATLWNITLENQRVCGIEHNAHVVAIEGAGKQQHGACGYAKKG